MDFSKLNPNEKMAAYASVIVLITAVVSLVWRWGALIALPLVAAVAMLAILFVPQRSPGTRLPGSKGSLMLIAGGTAAIFWALSALNWLGWIADHLASVDTLQFLVGLVASLVMGLTGWRAFQAEGGKFTIGTAGGGATAGTAAAMPPPAEPMPAPPAPPASEQTGTEPDSDEDRTV